MKNKIDKIGLFALTVSLWLVILGIISCINNEQVPPVVFLLTSVALFSEQLSRNIQS